MLQSLSSPPSITGKETSHYSHSSLIVQAKLQSKGLQYRCLHITGRTSFPSHLNRSQAWDTTSGKYSSNYLKNKIMHRVSQMVTVTEVLTCARVTCSLLCAVLALPLQVALALAYLHSRSIIFRDLKSANVLLFSEALDSSVNVKLTDYGIAALVSPSGIKVYNTVAQ